MDRANHYESAFEAYLREQGVCYVAVDETRRTLFGGGPVKSLDFIVLGAARLAVDVKGRRFPVGPPQRPRRVWECWSTRADIDGLHRWAERLGRDFRGLLAFVYQLSPSVELPDDIDDLWEWRGRRYLLRAVDAADYRRHMRSRSPRWDTVTLARADFRRLVRPVRDFTQAGAVARVAD
jgi:hypothetical protein